jgi:hypothetical protein
VQDNGYRDGAIRQSLASAAAAAGAASSLSNALVRRDSSVSVVSRLGKEEPMNRDSIPGGGSVLSIRPLTHRQYCTVTAGRRLRGDKAGGVRR